MIPSQAPRLPLVTALCCRWCCSPSHSQQWSCGLMSSGRLSGSRFSAASCVPSCSCSSSSYPNLLVFCLHLRLSFADRMAYCVSSFCCVNVRVRCVCSCLDGIFSLTLTSGHRQCRAEVSHLRLPQLGRRWVSRCVHVHHSAFCHVLGSLLKSDLLSAIFVPLSFSFSCVAQLSCLLRSPWLWPTLFTASV